MRVANLVAAGADYIAVADFDQDGSVEYVTGRSESLELVVYDAVTGEQPGSRIALDSLPVGLCQGDFDGDAVPELAVAMIDARLALYLANSNLQFSLARTIALPAPPRAIAVASNGGRPRVVVATGISIDAIDPIATDPDMPVVSALVVEAAEHLEGLAEVANYEKLLAQALITQREREVVSFAVRGLPAREIGRRLFIGERTVETHLAHAYDKLGVRSRFELLMRLSERGSPRIAARAR